MVNRRGIQRWVRRHQGHHLCACFCGECIEIKPIHHRKGIPNFIKGQNFSSAINPKFDGPKEIERSSRIWEMLSEDEKERRLSNLKKFPAMQEHPNWKGGRVPDENGYIRVRSPNHPFAADGYVLEHRLVMEQFLRETYPLSHYLTKVDGISYLKPEVVVHHLDERPEARSNNKLDNLYPFKNSAAHIFWHKSPLSERDKIQCIKDGTHRTKVFIKKQESINVSEEDDSKKT